MIVLTTFPPVATIVFWEASPMPLAADSNYVSSSTIRF